MGRRAKRNRQAGNTLYTNSKPINKDHLNSDRNYSTGPASSSSNLPKSSTATVGGADEINNAPLTINNKEEQKLSNINNGASINQEGKGMVIYSSSLNITNNKQMLPYSNLPPLSFKCKPHNISSLNGVDPRFLH